MSRMQTIRRKISRMERMQIVSTLVLRNWSENKIRDEVMKRLNLKTYSRQTVHADKIACIEEWRKERVENVDDAMQMELARIDDTCQELWEQWEKSKQDTVRVERKKKGQPGLGNNGAQTKVTSLETKETNAIGMGNVAYITEIRAQLQERRKLLGLYAPEKKELSGEMSFAAMLMESGMLDEAEAEAAAAMNFQDPDEAK